MQYYIHEFVYMVLYKYVVNLKYLFFLFQHIITFNFYVMLCFKRSNWTSKNIFSSFLTRDSSCFFFPTFLNWAFNIFRFSTVLLWVRLLQLKHSWSICLDTDQMDAIISGWEVFQLNRSINADTVGYEALNNCDTKGFNAKRFYLRCCLWIVLYS